MAIWQNYFENAYISCFHYLVKKKLHWTERLFWLITIFICTGSTYYIISKCVREYDSQKSVYRADTDYLYWETLFPSVVLCEKKARPIEYRAKLNKTLSKLSFNESFLEDIKENALDIAFAWPPIFSGTFSNNCPFVVEKCLQGNYSYIMSKIRRDCDDILTYCEYNNVQFKCCHEFLPVNTTFGTCFAFNNYGGRFPNESKMENPPWKITRRPGLHEGKLVIESKTSNVVISVLTPNAVPNLHLGKYWYKQAQSTILNEKMIYYHYVKIEETITDKEAKLVDVDHRGCRFPEENNLKYFNSYSAANCQIECFIRGQIKFCGCAAHTCPIPRVEECNVTGIICINDNQNVIQYTYEECHCLPDCFSTDIDTVGSTAKSVGKAFKWMNRSSVMRYVAIVPAPSLRYIRYTTTSSIDLLVLVGGTVGFFMGFSFLSIAQCFYYLFVRTVTDEYRLIMDTRKSKKEKKMDENFSLAKAKLRMVKVENDIKDVLKRKVDRNFS